MPVVTCTKCPTQLRVPEGATGNVKCPKCKTIFAVGAKAAPAPAFEVVDDDPPAKPTPAAKPVARPAPPPPPPVAKKSGPEEDFEFEDDDSPRKKRRRDRDDEDDDDDRDRDRPRSRRRRDDDDDDYDDDRGRSRRRRRRDRDDDYDDDYEYDRRPAKGSGYGASKTGVLLMGIGLWLYVGMYGVLALFFLIAMATNSMSEGLFAIPGICGAACTVLLLIGVSFCIAGPQKARGMAIATVCVAGVHLVLLIICYSKVSGVGGRGLGGVGGGFLGGGE